MVRACTKPQGHGQGDVQGERPQRSEAASAGNTQHAGGPVVDREDGAPVTIADDRVHLQVAETLALLHHDGPLFDIPPAHDDAPAVLGRSALAVALAACAQVLIQGPASLLDLPHMLVDARVGDHVAALAICQAHDLFRAELLASCRSTSARMAVVKRTAMGLSLLRWAHLRAARSALYSLLRPSQLRLSSRLTAEADLPMASAICFCW